MHDPFILAYCNSFIHFKVLMTLCAKVFFLPVEIKETNQE